MEFPGARQNPSVQGKDQKSEAKQEIGRGVTRGSHGQSSPTTLKHHDLPLLSPAITATTCLPNLLALLPIPEIPWEESATPSYFITLSVAPHGAMYKLKLRAPQPSYTSQLFSSSVSPTKCSPKFLWSTSHVFFTASKDVGTEGHITGHKGFGEATDQSNMGATAEKYMVRIPVAFTEGGESKPKYFQHLISSHRSEVLGNFYLF